MEPTERRQQFLEHYRTIRYAEGRGSEDPAYYLALPYQDLTGKNSDQWRIRGKSFRYFERVILPPLERRAGRPLKILDLGAGNCWMSYRLSLRNHWPVGVDIFNDVRDGLLASRNYPTDVPVLEGHFDELPFPSNSFDLAIFNASIHYSSDYYRTLQQVRDCLRRQGCLVIMDSPIYKLPAHGERMRTERHAHFQRQYGFRSDALGSREFLDEPLLEDLGRKLNIHWHIHRVWYGYRWFLRPWKARISRRRPPCRFWILIGEFI